MAIEKEFYYFVITYITCVSPLNLSSSYFFPLLPTSTFTCSDFSLPLAARVQECLRSPVPTFALLSLWFAFPVVCFLFVLPSFLSVAYVFSAWLSGTQILLTTLSD